MVPSAEPVSFNIWRKNPVVGPAQLKTFSIVESAEVFRNAFLVTGRITQPLTPLTSSVLIGRGGVGHNRVKTFHTLQDATYLGIRSSTGTGQKSASRRVLGERTRLAIWTEMPGQFQVKRLSPPDVLVQLFPDFGHSLLRLIRYHLPPRLRTQSLPQRRNLHHGC